MRVVAGVVAVVGDTFVFVVDVVAVVLVLVGAVLVVISACVLLLLLLCLPFFGSVARVWPAVFGSRGYTCRCRTAPR